MVIESEHGPQGGDELNILKKGKHYGWPFVSLGTHYGTQQWPLNPIQGRHDGYEHPIHAWVPSVATSNLLEIKDTPNEWKGDLLLGTLKDQALYRLRMVDNKVVYTEKIVIGERIRDLIQRDNGTIVLWCDSARIIELELNANAGKGASQFRIEYTDEQKKYGLPTIISACQACHSIFEGQHNINGPSLVGIFERPIGSDPSFEYSSSMSKITGHWNDENLKEYLRNPQLMAEGTKMPQLPFFEDPETLNATINFLKTLQN